MGFSFNIRKMTLGMKIIYSVVALGIVAAIVIAIVMSRNGYLANTMRLLRVEGTVNIENGDGGTKPVIDNIRFQSGDALNTGADGLASVGLDDSKIVTLQNDSRAEFTKSGKRLELKLTKGALFFNVTEKLSEDETFEIKTSTMTAGIRGTSGYVYYDDDGRDSLIITDGVVIVTAINPETGETKYAEVRGGQKITVYLYSDRTRDSVEFSITDVKENDLPEFPLQMISENEELINRVCEFTGWDKEALKAAASSALAAVTANPDVTATPVPTSNATATPKPTNTVTPTPSSTPSPTPEPEETEESKETDPDATSTPTSTPEAMATPTTAPATPTPTTVPATPTSTPTTVPPTPTDEPVATPTEKPKPSNEPTANPSPTTVPEPEPEPEIIGYNVSVYVYDELGDVEGEIKDPYWIKVFVPDLENKRAYVDDYMAQNHLGASYSISDDEPEPVYA